MAIIDFLVIAIYFGVLFLSSIYLSRKKITNTKEYFLSSNSMPIFAVVLSVIATSQSAATFLGIPEFSYKLNLTFLGFFLSGIIASFIIAYFLIPKFYTFGSMTVYDYLEKRYSKKSKRYASYMFLIGRVIASGARLYIAALAISMILFLDISFFHVLLSSSIILLIAIGFTYKGGVKSVIYSDSIQAFTYICVAIIIMIYLYNSLNLDFSEAIAILDANSKLEIFSFEGTFNVYALLSGWLLLNIAAFGLDQDMTQRILTCKNQKEAQKSIIYSSLFTIPVVLIFLVIGLELYLFYNSSTISKSFNGEKVTIMMYYILNEMPDGLRGFVTIGAIAAALSSTNSVLGAMSSVYVNDIYKNSIKSVVDETKLLYISKKSVLVFAFLLLIMSLVAYYYQKYTDISLVSLALGVMSFAYSGLLGVYAGAILTSRGDERSVLAALIFGFLSVAIMKIFFDLNFAYTLFIASLLSFLVTISTKGR